MKKFLISLALGIILSPCGQPLPAAPVPYSGKVAINGANFQGDARFTFALRDADGAVHWRNGADANASVTLDVDRGLYVCLLGGNTMNDFPPSLFLENPELFLVVHFFRHDTKKWLRMQPDQLITSAPHALAAEVARNALTADAVKPGAITKSMLAAEVLADLYASVVLPEQNATLQSGSITLSHLSPGVRAGLNATITRSRLSPDVLADLNRSVVITRSMLPADVLADLNGTISRSRLPADVLADLNQTIVADSITLDKLSPQVRADLNQSIKVITRGMLPWDVLQDLNGTISRSRLSVDVLADLNQSIKVITRDMLPWDVLEDLNGTISRSRLSVDVLADLNQSIKVITRAMLPWDVLEDLNGTISRSRLSVDVLDDLNQSIKVITRDMLPWDVLQDLNGTISRSRLAQDVLADLNQTIGAGSITLDKLSPQVLADLNRTVTKSMLGQDVLADLNRTVTATDIAANTITTAQLNESILKYLRPEITTSPQAPGLVFGGQSVTLLSQAEGKYLTYQWNRNGQPVAGAIGATLVIADVNGTLHDGNYTLVVSNDFGSVTSSPTSLQVDGTPTNHSVASIGMQMIFCPPGTFAMGSPSSETGRGGDETQHQVTLTNGFYLGKYELTQAQYETVMNGNSEGLSAKPSEWPNNDDRPVEKVSWNDAQVFLTRLNSIEQTAGRLPNGWQYVLPTEAEWEYACRAGTTTAYSWGNDINASHANWNHGADPNQTTDVGQYAANPWGFYDMHGNVWEWTFDWKANYPGGAQTDPEGSASGSYRVTRGGSWLYSGTNLRSARRSGNTPGDRNSPLGFRVGFKAISADEANPELALFGGAGITREAGQPWAEPGVAAHDARDGILTSVVTITGTVDVNSTGTYLLTYSVADAAGNEVNATRTVTVSDTTAPVVTLLGDANVTHAKDVAWVDPGATASDTLDGNLTNQVTITGAVDVNSTGTYVLTYSVSDGAGNDSNVTRTVNVGMATTHTVQGASNLQMLWVEPGTFTMGSPTSEAGRNADREDEHNVTLTKGFYLGKYEVTQAQYEAVMTGNTNSLSATPSQYSGNDRPVEKVSWNDVQIFLTRLNAAEQTAGRLPTGWSYVLPTESEWEYACRAGTTTAYSWGNDINSSNANYDQSGIGQTRDLGQYAANPWGFFDMHGNVSEWTSDWYAESYPTGSVTDPVGSTTGSYRVLRGGSWQHTATSARSAGRGMFNPADGGNVFGFRVGFKFTGVHTVTSASNLEMLWVEPGTFTMGSPTNEAGRNADREDEHNVTLTKGFYLGKYEVTQAQYQAVMTGNTNDLNATPSEWPGNANRPVEKVSWNDVQVFLTRLNAAEQAAGRLPAGWSYALPTESEWEYACRAGTTAAYSWGNAISPTDANWNHGNDANQTVNVGQYAANPWGFFDMHGNVGEWTADWYQAAYPSGTLTDPTGPASGQYRVKRGSSWLNAGSNLRSARRTELSPGGRGNSLGFRVGFKASQ
jgi:formylglycine-generating enzyme required for sulfatase activity